MKLSELQNLLSYNAGQNNQNLTIIIQVRVENVRDPFSET